MRGRRSGAWVGAIIAIIVVAGCSGGATEPDAAPAVVERDDWAEDFDAAGVSGTFALRRVGDDLTEVFDRERAAEPMLPASTFKILNTMVILETGARDDVDEVVEWDGVDRGRPEWNRDHSLRSGIEVSAVWMFQELAREVGEEQMAEWVGRAGYGNADISGGIDQFWLRGDLRISALEQLDFLESLATGDLPFSPEVIDQTREILVRERGDDWAWSHKTGTALAVDPTLGWLVGLVDNHDDVWVFALNVDMPGVDGLDDLDPAVRERLARTLLEREGVLPNT